MLHIGRYFRLPFIAVRRKEIEAANTACGFKACTV